MYLLLRSLCFGINILYLCYWINDISQEVDHARLRDDAKLKLKQPNLG